MAPSPSVRVSQNTPISSDRGAHLPNWAPYVQNQPKKFSAKSEKAIAFPQTPLTTWESNSLWVNSLDRVGLEPFLNIMGLCIPLKNEAVWVYGRPHLKSFSPDRSNIFTAWLKKIKVSPEIYFLPSPEINLRTRGSIVHCLIKHENAWALTHLLRPVL